MPGQTICIFTFMLAYLLSAAQTLCGGLLTTAVDPPRQITIHVRNLSEHLNRQVKRHEHRK